MEHSNNKTMFPVCYALRECAQLRLFYALGLRHLGAEVFRLILLICFKRTPMYTLHI